MTIKEIMERLDKAFPNSTSELEYINNYTFLVAVVLSAQSTDKAVNKATKSLFKIIKTPEDMITMGINKLIEYIRHIGLYNSKAKHLIALSQMLIDKYNSGVPLNRSDLESLPGVGRKTANVVLNHLTNAPFIAVDTHVKRLSNRLKLSNNSDPLKIEKDLYKVIPAEYHNKASDLLVLHGRYICKAKKPNCQACVLKDLCPLMTQNSCCPKD